MTNLELFDTIIDAQNFLVENWGEAGKEVIALCFKAKKFDGNTEDYLQHCTACGGNWGGMFLSGIRALYPEVWEAIPENLGIYAFTSICNVLILLGVRTWE